MTADEYLQNLLVQITAPTGIYGPGESVRQELRPAITGWAGTQLADLSLSGSYAKGTAISGGTDVDLLISLKSDTTNTLKEIFDSLAAHMRSVGYDVRRQSVSIGITHRAYKVDLVPGKRQASWGTDHSLWVSRQNTWQKTNVETHVQVVRDSHHADVIRLMKRWRQVHSVEMPSFALELATLRALDGRWIAGLSLKVFTVLEFLRDVLPSAALMDPANTNNNVVDELTATEKRAIAQQARQSREAPYWENIVW